MSGSQAKKLVKILREQVENLLRELGDQQTEIEKLKMELAKHEKSSAKKG